MSPIVNFFNPGRKLKKNARSNFSNLKVILYFGPQIEYYTNRENESQTKSDIGGNGKIWQKLFQGKEMAKFWGKKIVCRDLFKPF